MSLGAVRKEWKEVRGILARAPTVLDLLLLGFVGGLAAGALTPVLPLYLADRGFSYTTIGALGVFGGLAGFVTALAGGRVADRFGRGRVAVGSMLLSSLLLPGYLLAKTAVGFALLQSARGALAALLQPLMRALTVDATPWRARATVLSFLGATSTLGMVLGMVLGGFLAHAGYVAVFLLATLASLALLPVLVRLMRSTRARPLVVFEAVERPPGTAPPAAPRPPVQERRLAVPLPYLAFSAGFESALAAFPLFVPIFLAERGLPPHAIGIALAASWFCYALAQPVGGRLSDRLGHRKAVLLPALAAAAAMPAAMALAPHVAFVVAAWVMLGVFDGLARPVAYALLADHVPTRARGRAFGALHAWSLVVGTGATLAWGLLADRAGLAAVLLGSALALAAAVLAILVLPDRRMAIARPVAAPA